MLRIDVRREDERLAHAAILGDDQRVEELLVNGANPNHLHFCGTMPGQNTPLQWACIFNDPVTVQALIQGDASLLTINVSDRQTALHLACKHGAWACAHLLLRSAFESGSLSRMLQAIDMNGQTALDVAIGKEAWGLIDLLLGFGAGMDFADSITNAWAWGLATAIAKYYIARKTSNGLQTGWCNLPMCCPDTFANCDDQLTLDLLLCYCAIAGDVQTATLALQQGANPNRPFSRDFDGCNTPLHWACYHGHVALVVLLLEYGASRYMVNEHDEAPAHVASQRQHLHCVFYLLQNLARIEMPTLVNARNMNGHTALGLSAEKPDVRVVHLLISCGANVWVRARYGMLAAHLAASAGQVDNCLCLLDHMHWQYINVSDNRGYTLLYLAVKSRHLSLAHLLLERGANPNCVTDRGYTPAHEAAFINDVVMLKLLRVKKADFNVRSNAGKTALGIAWGARNVAAVRFLVRSTSTY
eukprot:m.107360 g.107360  ORF g.107360 m.107360 type:complete len:472 (+) comp15314_c0_seq3:221-1636(+)